MGREGWIRKSENGLKQRVANAGHATGDAERANAAIAECQCSHNVELVALHCLGRRVLQVVVRLVVHVPIIAGVHAVVVAAQA